MVQGLPRNPEQKQASDTSASVRNEIAGAGETLSGIEDLPRALGRYVLLKRIARGGMGEVFLASTTGLEGAERPVVVKIIRRDHAKDPSFIARFLDEARVQAQLQHSGVAQVLDAAIDDRSGEPYAVVEHVEGRSLGDVRARAIQLGKALGWADASAVATLIAEALAHVHERQDASGRALAIVHRDLSPQNVMVGYGGDVKIIDFGTARGQDRRCHTVQGVVFAKPGYVAPEVANGDSGDSRVDLYALGIMLWELCAGRRFLQGDANVHMAAVARNGKSPPPVAEQLGAPVALDAIIAKLTAFDRETRYVASRAAAADLAKLLAGAPPLPSGERGIRARTAVLMTTLFPGEPGKGRGEFQRLVVGAREVRATLSTPVQAAKQEAFAASESEEGMLPGTRYRLKRELGRGSSSIVYEAEHVDLQRLVAIKVMASEQSRSSDFSERFRREARALSRLYHENLIAMHDFGLASDGRLFCVMELLEGETLESFLAREKGADWREALSIVERALLALEVAHGANIVHRDIKPANLFLCDPFGLKLLDFGLAKTSGDASSGDSSSRGAFTLLGTPEYMAPEQATSGQVDARADLYALGCVLYEMTTGRLPFVGSSAVAILEAKIQGSPERPRDRAPARGIPAEVEEIILRALARHPSVRFQTATEMRRAVLAALDAPGKKRASRRVVGFAALAATMAFAGVLLAGKARDLTFSFPWLADSAPVAVAMDEPAAPAPAELEQDPSAGITHPDDEWARAERGEDPQDSDKTDARTASASPPPAEEPAPEASEPPKKQEPRKPARPARKRKGETRKPKASAQASAAAAKTPAKAVEPSVDDEPQKASKADASEVPAKEAAKPAGEAASSRKTYGRRKKKSRMAHVE